MQCCARCDDTSGLRDASPNDGIHYAESHQLRCLLFDFVIQVSLFIYVIYMALVCRDFRYAYIRRMELWVNNWVVLEAKNQGI